MAYQQQGQQYNPNNPPPPPPPPPGHRPRPLSFMPGDDTIWNSTSDQPQTHPQRVDSSYSPQYGGASVQSPVSARRPPMPPYPANSSAYSRPYPGAQQYQPHSYPAQPSPQTYNPADFAPSSPAPNRQPNYTSYPPPPLRSPATTAHRPYNPAAYHDNSIANAANQMYGTVSSPTHQQSFPATQAYARQPMSPTQMQQPYQENQYSSRLAPEHNQYQSHRPLASAPLPSRPFQQPSPSYPPPRSFPNSSHDISLGQQAPAQPYTPSPAHLTPSPDSRDNRSPAQDYIQYQAPSYDHSRDSSQDLHFYSPSRHNDMSPGDNGSPSSVARTGTFGRHPQSRPLPGPPTQSDHGSASDRNDDPFAPEERNADQIAQDDLFNQVESAVLERVPYESDGLPENNGVNYEEYSDSDAEAEAGLEAMRMAEEQEAADEARRTSSGYETYTLNGITPKDSQQSQQQSQSLPPTPQRQATQQQYHYHDRDQHVDPASEHGSEGSDDYGGIDMSTYGGGFDAPYMSYGGEPADLARYNGTANAASHQPSSSRTSALTDNEGYPIRTSSHASSNRSGQPYYAATARVDEAGTGGLADPSQHNMRKLSFDEGDESGYLEDEPGLENQQRASQDSLLPPETSPDMFYQTGTSGHLTRPLPPPPEDEQQSTYLSPGDAWNNNSQTSAGSYPVAPSAYAQSVAVPVGPGNVPRSLSLLNSPSAPQQPPPARRAKTDAEERKRQTMIRVATVDSEAGFDQYPQTPSNLGLDLPTLPAGKRFQPSKLTQRDFETCAEPWALSAITTWLRNVTSGESELKEEPIVEALAAFFTAKVTNMNIAESETLAGRVVKDLLDAGALIREEEWIKFGLGSTSGVLFQMTGKGCYTPSLHDYEGSGRCYAHHCQRTVKKINLQDFGERHKEDWATFYRITKEDIEGVNKRDIERQNNLHEIVQTEDGYMDQLKVLEVLYRDALRTAVPPIIPPKQLKGFLKEVFGKLDAVRKANENYLLPQLKYRQQEQGPWIVNISDIFRDWIRKAKKPYIEYAANFPNANFLMQQEDQRNVLFHSFLEGARANKMSNRLDFSTFLKAPITRLQRYSLLLQTVLKNITQETEEKTNLQIAIDEIKAVTLECDSRVAEMGRKTEMFDLAEKLQLRPEMKRVELNLGHLGRELIHRGDVQRLGNNRFTWLETHALLFDHYLVLAKIVIKSDSTGGARHERYDVSKMPIPMELLVLESTDDDAVTKSVKGVSSVSVAGQKPAADTRSARSGSVAAPQPGNLTHTNTNNSLTTISTTSSNKTMVTTTVLETGSRDEKILYPFKIKHLGTDTYTLYAPTSGARKEWCDKIIEAKTKHAASLFQQNAEPFRLRIMADAAFAYDQPHGGQGGVIIKGSPLSRAVDEVERAYSHTARPGPVCRARVNCATTFHQQYGKHMVAVGTDYGVYVAEVGNPRGWTRAIASLRVTQIAVLEEFNLFLLIADKSLIAYHLDIVCPLPGTTPANDSQRKAPQKLSGSRDVGFFVTGRMKDRTLVFYKKREGISSTFKILEPILQNSSKPRPSHSRGLFHSLSTHSRGNTDSFRDYDDFYIPTDCLSLSLFSTSLAVSTTKGFEVLNLDKKQTWSVPDLKQQHVSTIAQRLANQEPLGMFRLDENEFLCVYEECACYCNKHGDVSRSVVLEFVGRANAAAVEAGFLVLFDNDFVEIRDAANGRLKQVIQGKDVRCLDDGRGGTSGQAQGAGSTTGGGTTGSGASNNAAPGGGKRTVKFAMMHPESERLQLIVELVLNVDEDKK